MAFSQFGNMLLVSNVYLHPKLRPLVPYEDFFRAMQHTIALLDRLTPISPIFGINSRVLQCAANNVQRAKHAA
jgi:hypothetical protein